MLQQLGLEGLGVRLNYGNPPGAMKVPFPSAANIKARPAPAFNPNGVNSDYDFIQRTGAGTGTDTSVTASMTEGLADPTAPLPFPGPEDPLGNGNRMLIGTFTLETLFYALPYVEVTAVDPFAGVQIISGPNPPITAPRNDGTTGPVPGNGMQDEIQIDQYLAQNLPTPQIPTLLIVEPEPGTLALSLLAAGGLAIRCRRPARHRLRAAN